MSSKRNIRRLIKQKTEEFVELLNEEEASTAFNFSTNSSETEPTFEAIAASISRNSFETEPTVDLEPTFEAIADSISSQNHLERIPLRQKIKEWFIKNKPTRTTADDMLTILKEEGLDVPKCIKTLVPNKEKIIIKKISPGFYSHFGIEKQIKALGHLISNVEEIIVDINIDGIPLFNSSRVQLYPILVNIVNVKNISIIPIGIYVGNSKPNDISLYLSDFVSEMKLINENGINIDKKRISFKIRAIICDAPAKAFVCGIVGHTSSHGCSKCVQIAKKVDNVLTYSTELSELITNDDFRQRIYKSHHQKKFRSESTPLENINVEMISQIPLDPMHLVDLGVTRKIVLRLIQNKVNFEIPSEQVDIIFKSLEELAPFIPKEFVRGPRGLKEIYNWKATEFRQLLLYTGILVLKDNVPNQVYNHFLLIHCACRFLSMENNLDENIVVAKNLLEQFVRNFPVVFGENSVSYNVHGLLHLADCVKQFGILQNFSAYNFENYLQTLKKYVRAPTFILKQIFNKVKYENKLVKEGNKGFMIVNKIPCYYKNDNMFSTKSPNNYCFIKPKIPFKINKFIVKENLVVGTKLLNQTSFFDTPVSSLDSLGICVVDKPTNEQDVEISIHEIENKLMCLPYGDKLLLIPILHSCLKEGLQ